MDAGELLSWVYSVMVKNLDRDQREELDWALLPDSDAAVHDPDLPESLQGLRPPRGWSADMDMSRY